MNLNLGSLFDGSGGFPLAAQRAGITPVWASEIEPFAIRVTEKNFPQMLHLGDAAKINGAEIPPVDIITFGSPCQDLSVAGSKAGLQGARSKLFFQALRIAREMYEFSNGLFPRYLVWENVTGAFSSNKGEDFYAILQAVVSLVDSIAIPRPQKWNKAGFVRGNGYSLAWRVLDAQYWGVPQHRERIFLVFDFRSERADEILFESQYLQGNFEKTQRKKLGKQTSAGDSTNVSKASRAINYHLHTDTVSVSCYETDIARTVYTSSPVCNQGGTYILDNHLRDKRLKVVDTVPTLTRHMGTGGNNIPLVAASISMHSGTPVLRNAEVVQTLTKRTCDYCNAPLLHTNDPQRIRALTPLECCRLQGFPDDWTDGLEIENPTDKQTAIWKRRFADIGKKKTDKQIRKYLQSSGTDSARYRLWGNGVALPCVQFVINQIANKYYER